MRGRKPKPAPTPPVLQENATPEQVKEYEAQLKYYNKIVYKRMYYKKKKKEIQDLLAKKTTIEASSTEPSVTVATSATASSTQAEASVAPTASSTADPIRVEPTPLERATVDMAHEMSRAVYTREQLLQIKQLLDVAYDCLNRLLNGEPS